MRVSRTKPTTTPWMVMAAIGLAVAGLSTGGTSTSNHPPLVDGNRAICDACHGELVASPHVHAPVADDCSSCHEVQLSENATRIDLAEDEPALCLACHDDLSASAEGGLAVPHAPIGDSCLACHDPHGSEHPRLLLAAREELCGGCHDREGLQPTHGGQLMPATDCTGCHRPHGSDHPGMLTGGEPHAPFISGSCDACHRQPIGERIRLRARGERLCEACHGEVDEQEGVAGSVHAALHGERGRAGCLSCHDPHVATRSSLLSRGDPDLCADCHAEIVEAATSSHGHAPAADGCLDCHAPHESSERRLLQMPAAELCVMCHDVEDPDLVSTHLGSPLTSKSCTTCHDPHGADLPGLLARVVHPPVRDGCDTCHEGSFDRVAENGGSELCLVCHDQVGEIVESAEVPHAALELAECAQCHEPHASRQDHLVRLPEGGDCLECHEDQAAREAEVAHGVIGLIGCQACHEPHGGSRPALLRGEANELCLSCHDPRRVDRSADENLVTLLGRFPVPVERVDRMATLRLSADGQIGHPVTDHRAQGVPSDEELKRGGTEFRGELTCLTCHDPHKGRSRQLLRWGASSAMEACIQCHPR